MKNKILFAILATVLVLITIVAASAQTFTITSTPATTATVGQQYSYQMAANTTGVAFSIVSGPEGLSVTTSGLFSWTPSTAGTFSLNISAAKDSEIIYQAFDVVVNQVESSDMLEIDEVEVKVNGKKDTLSGPGTVDDEAELGDEIEITVTVKNNFNTRADSTIIRNIDMEISSDLDAADGLDESISRLEAGRDDDMTVTFTIDPEDVLPEDAPFDITIDVEGRTSDGRIYSDSWTIKLDMDTKSRDLYILSVDASPLSFTNCNDNQVRLSVDLKNIGTRDLDDAALRLRMSDLGITKFISDIELDSGDDDDFSDYIIIPKGVAPGTYQLDIDALPQRTVNTVTSLEAVQVTVLKCSTSEEEEDDGSDNEGTGSNNNGNNGGTIIIPDVVVPGTPVSTAVGKKGLFSSDSTMYLLFLGVLIVLLLIVIVLLAVRLKD